MQFVLMFYICCSKWDGERGLGADSASFEVYPAKGGNTNDNCRREREKPFHLPN